MDSAMHVTADAPLHIESPRRGTAPNRDPKKISSSSSRKFAEDLPRIIVSHSCNLDL